MSLRKDFSSLRKRASAGVQPRNLLSPKVKKIGIPDETTINRGAIYVVSPSGSQQKERTMEMKTCFFLPISIVEHGLNEAPLHKLSIKSAEYNDLSIKAESHELEFRVSKQKSHLFFCYDNAYVDKMAIPRGTIDKILFSTSMDSFLVVLHKRFGCIMVRYEPKDDEWLLRFFRENDTHWGKECFVARLNDLEHIYAKYVKSRESMNKDPQTLVRVDSDANEEDSDTETELPSNLSSQSDSVLKNGLPSLPTPLKKPSLDNRATRSVTRSASRNLEPDAFTAVSIGSNGEVLVEKDEDPEEPKEQEVPAPFEPPLKYSLANGKKFAIAFNDFKTLYNNDWINDTLIDFFIAYEIDKAVTELKSIGEGEVYAFNSFFFTKLMSKPEDQEESPDYYANIQRWLGKVDLMSYRSVIIPINEHLHWYCCIIKDLPKLLRAAKRRHNAELKEKEADKSFSGPAPDDPENKPKAIAEVFVFDSLRHRHPNIEEPLRTIIDKYCQEKYGIPIPGDMIKFTNARVPQQRNFNDCGIHVICNVGKWLSEPLICESMWRKMHKKSRGYFNISERLLMRRKLIDLLLDLHKNQPPDESNSGSGKEEEESDDEIELISYFSSKPEGTTEGAPNETQTEEKATVTEGATGKEDESEPSSAQQNSSRSVTPLPEKMDEDASDSVTESVTNSDSPKDVTVELAPREKKKASRDSSPKQAPLIRTLDPRAKDPSLSSSSVFYSKKEAKSGSFFLVEHPQIRKMLMRHKVKVKPHTAEFLNKFFRDHTRVYGLDKELVIEKFVDQYNFFDPQKESMQATHLANQFKDQFTVPKAPMEEPFVIQDADDSNGELNRSVGDLRIASDDQLNSSDEIERDEIQSRRQSNGDDSDVEVVDEEWRIVLQPELKASNGSPKGSHHSRLRSPRVYKSGHGEKSRTGEKEKSGESILTILSSRKSLGPKRRRLDAKSDTTRRADKDY